MFRAGSDRSALQFASALKQAVVVFLGGLPYRQAGQFSQLHHVCRAAPAREGDDALWATMMQHAAVTHGAGGPPVGFPVGGVAHLVDAVVVGPLACQTVGATGVAVNQQAQGVIPVQAAEGLLQQGMVVKIAATADKNTHYTVHNVSVAESISIGPGDCTFVIVVLQARDG